MNKIKHFALAMTGVCFATAGLVACSSDDSTITNENSTTETENTSSTGIKSIGGGMAYDSFYLGQFYDSDERRFDSDPNNNDAECVNEDGDCAPYDLIIIIDRKKEVFSKLISQPSNYHNIFVDNESLLKEDIHPVLVDGVIDGFFQLETVSVKNTNKTKYRFRRADDGVLVATYPVVLR